MNRRRWIIAVSLCCILAGAGWFLATHHLIAGKWFERAAQIVDLRGTAIDAETYELACEKFPDSTVLWDIPFQGESYPMDTKTLTVSSLTQEDIAMLPYFTELTTLDARECDDLETLYALQDEYPSLRVRYYVTLGDTERDNEETQLTIVDADAQELTQKLKYFRNLSGLTLSGELPDGEALQALRDSYPQIELFYYIYLGGQRFTQDATSLDITGAVEGSTDELAADIERLSALETVNLSQAGLDESDCRALADRFPDITFTFNITVAGVTVSNDVEELDLSGITLENTNELEEALPYFQALAKVDMCDCGISNEDMDALGQRHPETRFIWKVCVVKKWIRTDAVGYISYPVDSKYVNTATNEDIFVLHYCVDLIAVDIGHMCAVSSLEWVTYTPNLTYLVISETNITDLTPLSTCKNLKFLEMYTMPATDYSPLVECTSLEDLNLGKTYGDPEPISHMTWLKNLWWSGIDGYLSKPSVTATKILPEALPNTYIYFRGAYPESGGWRKLANYYASRDVLGMFYGKP